MPNGWNASFRTSNASDAMGALVNIEAEQGLLGSLFLNNKAFEHVADLIAPEDFGHPAHGRIYSAISSLVANGTPANPATLAAIVKDDPAIGSPYLSQVAASAVTGINAPEYAKIIADLARRRDIISAAQDTIADAITVDPLRPAETVLDEAEERLFGIAENRTQYAGPVHIGTIMAETIGNIEAAFKAGGAITVDTGLTDLDRIISGMSPGDLCVLAGRPGMGKSAFAGTVAFNAAKLGKRVAIFSLEMSKQELSQRWLAGLTGISTDRQRHGQIEQREWDKLIEAGAAINSLGILVDDQPRLSVAQMRQRARRMRRRHGLDLIIIDHLHLIRQGGKQESRRLEIGDATSMLKAIAKELLVPVLLLAQLNRSVEHRDNKRPVLADLRESGDIEQDADVVLLLYREQYYLSRNQPRRKPGQTTESHTADLADWQDRCAEVDGLAEVEIAKNRHGRTDMVKLRFDGERQRFENLARGF